MQKIIDVSEHNGTVDWEKVKAAGYHAIIRVGYGNDQATQDDKKANRNMDECERLSIPYGVYLYSYADREGYAESESNHMLRMIEGRQISYPVFIDVEEDRYRSVSKRVCEIFCEKLEQAGYKTGVYASLSWWDSHLSQLDMANRCKWVAAWHAEDQGQNDCDLWQFTSAGNVDGVSGKCDMNVLYNESFANVTNLNVTNNVTIDVIARQVISGAYGDGDERKQKLGQMYRLVQERVNEYYKAASRVYLGDYGNGVTRKQKLAEAGYDYETVQKIVNEKYY